VGNSFFVDFPFTELSSVIELLAGDKSYSLAVSFCMNDEFFLVSTLKSTTMVKELANSILEIPGVDQLE
jgi:hypothetical protein